MAHGQRKHKIYDDYFTPKEAWEQVNHFIPKDKTIWECFYGDGKSARHLTELGNRVVSINIDFFDDDLMPTHDLCVSNPPFSKTKEVMEKLVERNKPFLMIMPPGRLGATYMIDLFKEQEDQLQIIIPRKRCKFLKADPTTKEPLPEKDQPKGGFNIYYYCWKMNLPKDINFI